METLLLLSSRMGVSRRTKLVPSPSPSLPLSLSPSPSLPLSLSSSPSLPHHPRSLYVWGENSGKLGVRDERTKLSPVKLTLPDPVVWVTMGWYHMLMITKNGDVYACGHNEDGKLGLGDCEKRNVPTRVPIKNIRKIVSGGHHTLFLDYNGNLFMCGWNNCGVLGTGDSAMVTTPTLVLTEVEEICAGAESSMCLKRDGTIMAWGVTIGKHESEMVPTPVARVPRGKKITMIGCWFGSCSFLTEDGELYTWGEGRSGRLGHGSHGDEDFPTPIMEFRFASPPPRTEHLWRDIFHWLSLGRFDDHSEFQKIPVEVIFHLALLYKRCL
jgi:hypothetical protein